MEKNEIFTFTAPNEVEVTAVIINRVAYEVDYKEAIERWLCYAQNRLFTYEESHSIWQEDAPHKFKYGEVLVEYCILPDYDVMLENYQHQIDMANDYADKTL